MKIGSSNGNGVLTITLGQNVNRIVANVAGWKASDTVTIGGVTKTPGVAYTEADPVQELTFDFDATNTITIQFAQRGFLQKIAFYSVA
jgi:hypothetical protein